MGVARDSECAARFAQRSREQQDCRGAVTGIYTLLTLDGTAFTPRGATMQLTAYVSFNGDCEAAFKLYEKSLAGELGPIFRYGGSALAATVPPEWADKIMHGSITIGGQVLMGADVAPDQYEAPKGISLSLHTSDATEAERVFEELGKDGRVVLPLEKTFWAERFGMVVDRFGIPWMINCEAVATSPLA